MSKKCLQEIYIVSGKQVHQRDEEENRDSGTAICDQIDMFDQIMLSGLSTNQ